MAKKTIAAAAIVAAAVAEVSKKMTDKTYVSLPLHAEIVVQVGPRQRMQKNKLVTVEEARNVIFTKSGYEAMDRDEEGETLHILTKVLGIPNYVDVEDPTTVDGKRKDFEVLYFAESDEDEEGDDEPQA